MSNDEQRIDDPIVDLNRYKLLQDHLHNDEEMVYVEVLFGNSTFALNAAIRDLEAIRHGIDDGKMLREPETDFEKQQIVNHLVALTRWLAKEWDTELP